jgi:sugar/nucleoside kinase (ribokinase family)
MSKKNILIISGASYDSIVYLDKFPEPLPQTIHESVFSEGPGSTGVGKASNLCHLGFNTSLQILVGDDYYGKQIRDFLSGKPVNQLVDIDPKGTERHVNLMNKTGSVFPFLLPVLHLLHQSTIQNTKSLFRMLT